MKITKKRLSILLTPAILLGLFSILWLKVAKPKLIEYANSKLPEINSAQNFATIEIEKIDFSLLKLQIYLNKPHITLKNQPFMIAPIVAEQIEAQIDIFDLIIGQLSLSKVTVNSLHWQHELHTKQKTADTITPNAELPIASVFKILPNIPVDRLILNNTLIEIKTPVSLPDLEIAAKQLILHNRKNELGFTASSLQTTSYKEETQENIDIKTDLNLILSNNTLKILQSSVETLNSKINFRADLKKPQLILNNLEGQVSFESTVDLQDIRNLMLLFLHRKERIPALMGTVKNAGSLSFNSLTDVKGKISVDTNQLGIDHFKLGQAKINALIEKNQIKLTEIDIDHSAGKAHLENLVIDQRPPYSFSTKLDIQNFDLQKLFASLGLNNIPAGLNADIQSDCRGSLKEINIQCTSEANVERVWVKASQQDNFHIVKLKSGRVKGQVSVNRDAVSYKSDITIGSSSGTSSGIINFQNGFNIEYATEALDFKDVETLAELDFKGLLKIKGNTQGDSNYGTIDADVEYSDARLSMFQLGNLKAKMLYKNLSLSFDQLQGLIGKTTYNGQLNLDFNNSTVSGDIHSDKFSAEDLMQVLGEKFNLQFKLFGQGNMTTHFSGPFDFWKLSYDMTSDLRQGSVAEEKFDKLKLHLTSDGEKIVFKEATFKKNKTSITLDGSIDTKPKNPFANLKVRANPLHLEESDYLLLLASEVTGIGYFDGLITGPIDSLEYSTNFTLKQVTYDKVEYPNSQGKFSVDKNYFKFNGQFFGRQLQSEIIWPWQQNRNYSVKILINDLNPLFLLPLVSLPQPNSDFQSRINAEIDLSAPIRSLAASNGSIKVTDFYLQRATNKIKLEKPVQAAFRQGFQQMDPVSLSGDENTLSVKMFSPSNNTLRFNIAADLQLKMFHFLVPFTQSLSGNLVLESQVLLKESGFELFGEGEIIDGYVNIKGFPQAIESINTPIEFSRSKILLSDITGQLGQSDITGFGQIDLLGPKNIAVNLKAIADNVELNFPDKILTAGKANVLFSGNWLPYNLKIDYKILNGLVEKDFDDQTNQAQTLKASTFLPPKQIEQLSPSLTLDVNIDASRGIIIKNKLLEGEAKGLLNIGGTPESPTIKGKIDITPGSKLIFKDTLFDIQTAAINFNHANEINPDLYISANSRVSDYDINLLVQGPSKSPSIKPTSQPPLSENDLFSLLALGVTSQTDQNLSSDTQQKQTGLEVLAAISNQSQINKKIQQKLGLTVQLAPAVDSTKNIAVPKVVVSKKLSNKLNASYSKPFTGNDQNQEIKLQYLYNSNVSILLNYQNKDSAEEDQISGANSNSKSIWGIDLEYRDEFK